jgi:hypothetical protein
MSELKEIRSDIKDLLKGQSRVETMLEAIPEDIVTQPDLKEALETHIMLCQKRAGDGNRYEIVVSPDDLPRDFVARKKGIDTETNSTAKLLAKIAVALGALTTAVWAVAQALY